MGGFDFTPAGVALIGSLVGGWIGVKVGLARMEERLSAHRRDIDRIDTELFSHPNGVKDRVHRAEAELIFHQHAIERLE